MVRKTTLTTLVVLAISSVAVIGHPFDGVRPVTLAPSDSTPVAGEVVTFTVGLNGTATGSESYSVSTSASSFSAIPVSVTPTAGSTSVTFTATVAAGASSTTVSVSGYGGLSSSLIYPKPSRG